MLTMKSMESVKMLQKATCHKHLRLGGMSAVFIDNKENKDI